MTDGSSHGMASRRRLLRVLGAAGTGFSLSGCSALQPPDRGQRGAQTTETRRSTTTARTATSRTTQSTGEPSPDPPRTGTAESRERRTVEGGRGSVNAELERLFDDGVEVYFPPGRYRLDPVSLSGADWSLVGDGATLVVPGDVTGPYLDLSGSNWTVDGFTVDLTAESAAPVNHLRGTDWAFRNVDFVGQMGDPERRKNSWLLFPAVTDEDGSGLVENVRAMDGSADPGQSSNRGLTWFGENNVGRLVWRGCRFSKWANNTLYGANSTGPLLVEDCVFVNTNVGVRIGGNTTVRGCTWLQNGLVPVQRWSGDANARGLWINSNQFVPGEITIEDCTFVMTGPQATSAITSNHEVADVAVRDTHVVQSNGFAAVDLPGGGTTTVRRATVTGDGDGPAIALTERDGSVIVDSCINHPGDGIRISNATDCRVSNTTVDVGGRPFDFRDAEVRTTEISLYGGCGGRSLAAGTRVPGVS